jgi:hypothetical protein
MQLSQLGPVRPCRTPPRPQKSRVPGALGKRFCFGSSCDPERTELRVGFSVNSGHPTHPRATA